MKRMLLIVDPQNDFITGSLAVPGAKTKMMRLADFNLQQYDLICVTLDSHPEDHCSFEINGGIWPKHCIYDSKKDSKVFAKTKALMESIKLKPTAGLGITNDDLEEIGAESYNQVDRVLQCLTDNSISTDTIDDIPDTVLENIVKRHNASKFKRKQLPIKIDRVWLQ